MGRVRLNQQIKTALHQQAIDIEESGVFELVVKHLGSSFSLRFFRGGSSGALDRTK